VGFLKELGQQHVHTKVCLVFKFIFILVTKADLLQFLVIVLTVLLFGKVLFKNLFAVLGFELGPTP
jgi:hypothetical protein